MRIPTITVRCRRKDELGQSAESAPARDGELQRYPRAGVSGAARFAFPAEAKDGAGFFCSKLVEDFPLVPEEETPDFPEPARLELGLIRALEHCTGNRHLNWAAVIPHTITETVRARGVSQ